MSAIRAIDTTISVDNANVFPNSGTVVIDSEQIAYSDKFGSTFINVQRGVNHTTAAAHATGALVLFLSSTVPTPPRPTRTPTAFPCRTPPVIARKAVFVIDTASNTVLDTVPVADVRISCNCPLLEPGVYCVAGAASAQEIVVNDGGNRLYAANRYDACFEKCRVDSGENIVALDTETNEVVATLPFYARGGMALNRSGTRLYATSDNEVLVIDPSANLIIDQIPVGPFPHGVAISPAGTRLYVANGSSGRLPATISVVDVAGNAVVATVLGSPLSFLPQGSEGGNLTVNPAGTRLYWSDADADLISVIDTATNAVIATLPASPDPFAFKACPGSMAVSPDGNHVYVANLCDLTISVVDTAANVVTNRVSTQEAAEGIALDPSGNVLYAANRRGVTLISTNAGTVVASVSINGGATSLAINSAGTRVYAVGTVPPTCDGDCNHDQSVTVNEILTMVNIALSNASVANCPSGDIDRNGAISIDEIVVAINHALSGCPND